MYGQHSTGWVSRVEHEATSSAEAQMNRATAHAEQRALIERAEPAPSMEYIASATPNQYSGPTLSNEYDERPPQSTQYVEPGQSIEHIKSSSQISPGIPRSYKPVDGKLLTIPYSDHRRKSTAKRIDFRRNSSPRPVDYRRKSTSRSDDHRRKTSSQPLEHRRRSTSKSRDPSSKPIDYRRKSAYKSDDYRRIALTNTTHEPGRRPSTQIVEHRRDSRAKSIERAHSSKSAELDSNGQATGLNSNVPLYLIKHPFECSHCGFKIFYNYKGTRPPFAHNVQFSEPSYIVIDPMQPPPKNPKDNRYMENFYMVGSDCCNCRKMTCAFNKCSIFYRRNYCHRCSIKLIHQFPADYQAKIRRRHQR